LIQETFTVENRKESRTVVTVVGVLVEWRKALPIAVLDDEIVRDRGVIGCRIFRAGPSKYGGRQQHRGFNPDQLNIQPQGRPPTPCASFFISA
jgi:hypothetical protein